VRAPPAPPRASQSWYTLRTHEQWGFVREGLLREAMMHHGQWCDFLVMGLLEHEWRQRQHPA
jgi:RimJ/RimL family protein N-acetyltransferase